LFIDNQFNNILLNTNHYVTVKKLLFNLMKFDMKKQKDIV